MDYRVHAADGKIIHVRSINSLIREDEKGQIIQRIDFDITDRVKLESMLKRRSYDYSGQLAHALKRVQRMGSAV